MRKITENMLHAIRHAKAWHNANTSTQRTLPHEDVPGLRVYLHNNQIAFVPDDENAPLKFTLAGWDTATTRNRLSAIAYEFCGCHVGRVKGETRVTFPRYAYTSGPGSFAPQSREWFTLNRKHVNARHTEAA